MLRKPTFQLLLKQFMAEILPKPAATSGKKILAGSWGVTFDEETNLETLCSVVY